MVPKEDVVQFFRSSIPNSPGAENIVLVDHWHAKDPGGDLTDVGRVI